jgi:hypothetical protein
VSRVQDAPRRQSARQTDEILLRRAPRRISSALGALTEACGRRTMREAFAFKGRTRGGSAAEASPQGTERTARLEHGVGSLMSERLTRSSRRVTKVAARSRAGMQADGRQVAVGGGAAARERRDKRGLPLRGCPAVLRCSPCRSSSHRSQCLTGYASIFRPEPASIRIVQFWRGRRAMHGI